MSKAQLETNSQYIITKDQNGNYEKIHVAVATDTILDIAKAHHIDQNILTGFPQNKHIRENNYKLKTGDSVYLPARDTRQQVTNESDLKDFVAVYNRNDFDHVTNEFPNDRKITVEELMLYNCKSSTAIENGEKINFPTVRQYKDYPVAHQNHNIGSDIEHLFSDIGEAVAGTAVDVYHGVIVPAVEVVAPIAHHFVQEAFPLVGNIEGVITDVF